MRSILFAVGILTFMAGCASVPEPCTRDFFAYQADVMQRDFARRNRGEVRRLQTLREDLQSKPDVFTALALVSAKNDLETVVKDVRAQVIPEARGIAARCGIDDAFDTIMDGFLVEQGIDPDLVRTLGLIDLFEDPALEATLTPEG